MLHGMDDIEASCVLHVMVGMFTHPEQSKTSLLTVKETGIVWLTVHHNLTISVSFMYYHGDYLRKTSTNVLSLKQYPMYS
jgi:hypothetical protein